MGFLDSGSSMHDSEVAKLRFMRREKWSKQVYCAKYLGCLPRKNALTCRHVILAKNLPDNAMVAEAMMMEGSNFMKVFKGT